MIRPDFEQWRRKEVARLLALVEEESHYYQRIVANLPSGLVVLSEDLRILGANRAFCQLFGVSSKDIQEQPLKDLLPVSALLSTAQTVLREGTPEPGLFFNLPLRGKETPFRASLVILHPTEEDSHSQEEQLLIVLDDLTPLEKWRRKAEEPMEGLADLLAYSEGVFWEADPDTLRFSYVTGAPERLLGFPASQWTAEPDFWIRHLHPQDRQRVLSLARLAVQQGLTPQAVDIRMMGIDGEEVALRNVIAPVRSPDGQVSRLRGYLRRSSPGDAANPGRSSARHLPVNGAQATALALGVPLLAALFWLLRRADR